MENKNFIKCKTCGEEIAKSAKACPKCGAKNKQPIYKKPAFYVLVVLVIAIAAAIISVNMRQASRNIAMTVSYSDGTVTTEKLKDIRELSKSNEAQFKSKYKYATVTFTDTVKVVKGATNYNGVKLDGYFETNSGICVKVQHDSNGVLSQLNEGDEITISNAMQIEKGYTYSLEVYVTSPDKQITVNK